jgi:glycosyltransferase involved in cell wall biosynthesis
MKVALDVSAVPQKIAGVGRYIAEIARRLPEEGVETTLVTRKHDVQRWSKLSSAMLSPVVPDNRVQRLAYEALLLGSSGAAKNADVWHGPHYTMPHGSKTPCVVTIHDLMFFTNPEWHEKSKVAFFRRAISYSAKHAKVLLSISDFTARQIEEFLPGHAPVVVAPLGVDLARFTTDASNDRLLFEQHGLRSDVPYVFFLGTMEPRKGLDVLLRSFAELAAQDQEVELWLAGQSGWGLKDLEAQISVHPASGRIKQLGFVAETVLPALLRQARGVAYPSRGEGFGLPVLEALACGASVVTSRDTVMEEIAGPAAQLIPIGDSAALTQILSEVVASNDELRAQRSLKARERAQTFTWERSLRQHLTAYEQAK